MAVHNNLTNAKRLKNDEFYTMYEDIEKELIHYEDQIKQHAIYIPCGAAVYCNCDNPSYSNFFEYFCRHAVDLKLKWVAATWYDINDPDKESTFAAMFKYPEELDPNDYDPDDWKDYVSRFEIPGNGDFRSEACIEIMKQADIIVTNPPFSLFREFVAQLVEYNKKFLIIGNQNAVTYKEIFPLIKENKLWFGLTFNGANRWFKMPDNREIVHGEIKEDGHKYAFVAGVRWFTNLDHSKRHERMELKKSYTGHEDEYPKYDNYNAIEINKVNAIPNDYNDIMGVPITWVCNKYCPTLFEIIGYLNSSTDEEAGIPQLKFYNDFKETKQDMSYTGATGKKAKGNGMLKGKINTGNFYYKEETQEYLHSVYSRILIRRRPEDIERYGNR